MLLSSQPLAAPNGSHEQAKDEKTQKKELKIRHNCEIPMVTGLSIHGVNDGGKGRKAAMRFVPGENKKGAKFL